MPHAQEVTLLYVPYFMSVGKVCPGNIHNVSTGVKYVVAFCQNPGRYCTFSLFLTETIISSRDLDVGQTHFRHVWPCKLLCSLRWNLRTVQNIYHD